MKIEIIETIEKKRSINISLPYYYKHDLMLDEMDSVIFGKIEAEKTTTIQITDHYLNSAVEYELKVEKCTPNRHACYLTDEYKSSEIEYLSAKEKMFNALSEA